MATSALGAQAMMHTHLCDLLEIEHPIVLAGMNDAAGPELAAAVSNAGGLGMLGAAGLQPEQLDEWIQRTAAMTSAPFGVDTLLPSNVPDEVTEEQLHNSLPKGYLTAAEEIRKHFEIPGTLDSGSPLPVFSQSFFDRQIEVVMDHRVPVYAAGLGDPARFVDEFHRRGTKVIGVVGSVRNARRVADGGVDVIVAQGHEAGGHNSRIGTMVLVPQVVDAVGDVPVVAAGGIGDGRGIVASLVLGAQGVWLGTRFLVTPEANIPDGQKKKILEASADDTIVTRYLTGKPVRMLKTPMPCEFEVRGLPPLPMPQMGIVSGPLFGAAERAGRYDLNPGPAGQISGILDRIQPAGEVLTQLVHETRAVFEQIEVGIRKGAKGS